MKNIFNHYYLFTESVNNQNILTLKAKTGDYSPLEKDVKALTKIVMTSSHPIYFTKCGKGKGIINPFKVKWISLAHLNNNQDTIIVISHPNKKEIEFFISENNKEVSLIIYDLFKSNYLEDLMEEVKAIAHTFQ